MNTTKSKVFYDLLEDWSEKIDSFESGYNYSCFELDYDMLIRDEIQELLENKEFMQSINKLYLSKLNNLDNSFKKLVIFKSDEDKSLPFWKRKFRLKNAGPDYLESLDL